MHVRTTEHLQSDPSWPEGQSGPRLPPVQRQGAALAQPRGAAAGTELLSSTPALYNSVTILSLVYMFDYSVLQPNKKSNLSMMHLNIIKRT